MNKNKKNKNVALENNDLENVAGGYYTRDEDGNKVGVECPSCHRVEGYSVSGGVGTCSLCGYCSND